MKTIKRFDIASVCKLIYIMDLILMAIIAVPMTLLTVFVPGKDGAPPLWLMPIIMIVIHPIMAAIMSAIACAIYNAMAGKFGGIRVEIE